MTGAEESPEQNSGAGWNAASLVPTPACQFSLCPTQPQVHPQLESWPIAGNNRSSTVWDGLTNDICNSGINLQGRKWFTKIISAVKCI